MNEGDVTHTLHWRRCKTTVTSMNSGTFRIGVFELNLLRPIKYTWIVELQLNQLMISISRGGDALCGSYTLTYDPEQKFEFSLFCATFTWAAKSPQRQD